VLGVRREGERKVFRKEEEERNFCRVIPSLDDSR